MSEWRERVVGESTELTELIVRLRRFMVSKEYYELPAKHRALLREQAIVMNNYADILIQRLESAK